MPQQNNNPRFELTIQLRDHLGKLTGKTKSFSTDDAVELEQLWIKNNSQKRDKNESSRRSKTRKSNSKTEGRDGESGQAGETGLSNTGSNP